MDNGKGPILGLPRRTVLIGGGIVGALVIATALMGSGLLGS